MDKSSSATTAPNLTLTNITLQGNTTTGNGGALALLAGTVNYKESTVSGNTAAKGAAIYMDKGSATEAPTLTLEKVNITENTASGSGGGIAIYSGTVTYKNSSLSKNTAENAAGIYIDNGTSTESPNLTLDNVTIKENTASNSYGGVYAGSSITLAGKNIIIKENTLSNGNSSNLYLKENKLLTVTANISGSSIGINKAFIPGQEPSASTPISFTQGYGLYNSSTPAIIFTSENDYAISLNSGEAVFAVSVGVIYNPTNYSFTTNLYTKDENNKYSFYPGSTKTFTLELNSTFTSGSTSKTLYYNYVDRELYEDLAFTKAAASSYKVTWSAAVYNGAIKVCDIEPVNISGGVSITIPASIIYEDTYTLKINYKYMGLSYNANYRVYGEKTVSNAAEIIPSLTENTTLTLTGTLSEENITSLKNALKTLGETNSNVKVTLDLSATDGITTIPREAFAFCTALQGIIIPEGITKSNLFAFRNCTSLSNVSLPSTYTEINQCDFYTCTSLTSITIPASVTLISYSAFEGCSNLENITFLGTTTQWDNVTKRTNWKLGIPATQVQCSDGTVSIE